jgi:hypothetical protein
MKKLTYLFLALLIVACSSDDSSDGNQLFLEKYDSIVWQRLPLSNDYDIRIAFINSSNSITQYGDEEGEEVYCSSYTIDGTINLPDNVIQTISIQEETENSLSILVQIDDGEYVDSYIAVYTVTSDGSSYTLTQTRNYDEYEDVIYNRTDYDVCF